MSKVDLSAGWITTNLSKLFDIPPIAGIDKNSGLLKASLLPGQCSGKIMLMRGEVPSNLASLLTISTRINDCLVIFNTGEGVKGSFQPTSLLTNPVIIQTDYVKAIASGTVTWFWWVVGFNANTSIEPITKFGTTDTLLQCIYGTVGNVNSTADLLLDTGTSVSIGQNYRISNLELKIPTQFGYA